MSKKFCDMHIHTKYSCDSPIGLEAYCLKAIREGIGIICFTDHVDSNPNDVGYGFYNAEKYFNEFDIVKEKYGRELTILSGIEFAEPHTYPEILSRYSSFNYDYIMSTIHFWYENMYPSAMLDAGISTKICYEYYWEEVLKAVVAGGFDCLGHMDFPKRYYKQLVFDQDKIAEIFSEMVGKNISLEINTSTLRQNLAETMPDKELLSIYRDCGGRYVTTGSDTHIPDDLSYGYEYVKKLIGHFGFNEVYYRGRIPTKL